MQLIKLKDLIINKISGEWGEEGTTENGIKIIRTTNFTNTGKIDYTNIAYRIISPEKVEKKRILKGDIIIEKSGGSPNQPVGRVVFFDKDDSICLTNNFTAILRPNADLIYNKFLFYTLFFLHKRGVTLRYQNKTTGIINLRLDKYLEEKISLPSISDQIKIAKILSWAEELIEERKESIDLLDELLRSKFWDMFVINSKYTSWNNYRIKELVENNKHAIKAGPFGSSLKKEYYVKSGYKIYGQEQVIKDDFDYGDYYIDEQLYKKLESCKIKAGDVLISLVGTFGKISIVPDTFEPGIINPRLMKISFDKEKINAIFFKHLFQFPLMQRNILSVSRGGTMGILNVGIVKELKMICPPLPLQNQFAAIVEEVESIRKDYKQSHSELENLYGSLSQRAFKGELDLSHLDITEELKAHEENFIQHEEQEESSRQEDKKEGTEIKHIEEEEENLTASIIHAALDWPIESKVFNTEQIANLLKEKYIGFHFSFEMAYRYLSKRIRNIDSYYFYSEELLANPTLKNEANFKDFFESALKKKNQFIQLDQQFYHPEKSNLDLRLTEEDYNLWKDKKDRSGIYFSII